MKILLQKLQRIDCSSAMHISYVTHRDCDTDSGSHCVRSGICRCGKLRDIEIEMLDIKKVAQCFVDALMCDFDGEPRQLQDLYKEIQIVLIANDIGPESLWKVNVNSGYYGEEISSVVLCDAQTLVDIQECIERCC